MRIDILTGFPKQFQGPLSESILRRAQDGGFVEIVLHDLRDYAHDRHRTIDDTPYGGGAGMLLKPEPIFECADELKAERAYDEVILTTPHGETYAQGLCKRLSLQKNLMLICGHYKGVDHRVIEGLVTREISIGDFVLTGGELAAAVIVDSIVRLLPGVLGDSESMLTDSFMDDVLDSPYYTRPPVYRGMSVPDALLSGDHERVRRWRDRAAMDLTRERRPDILGDDASKDE